MKTVTFKSIVYGALGRLGQQPELSAPSAATIAQQAQYIQTRIREAWEFAFWPELMEIEQRAYRDAYAAGTTYALDAEVYNAADEKYYISLQAANTGNDPATETAWWEEQTDLDRYVAYAQTGQTEIGSVEFASTRNPRKSTYPGYLSFFTSNNGIQLTSLAPALVWLQFRPPVPLYSGVAYAAGTTYAADDVRYLASTGECYRSLAAANTGNDPATATAWWVKVDFPSLLAPAVTQGVYADGLVEDRQQTKARAQQGFYVELQRIHSVVFAQQGQVPMAQVQGY